MDGLPKASADDDDTPRRQGKGVRAGSMRDFRVRSAGSHIAGGAGIGALALVFLVAPLEGQALPAWRLNPEVRMGQDDENGQPTFTRVLAVLSAMDGTVIIADAANREIHTFESDGTYSHSIGRDGRGPGEFERLSAVGLLGDTLWVIDGRERRTSLFSLDGAHLATIRTVAARSSSGLSDSNLTALVAGDAALGSASASFGSEQAFQDERKPVLRMTRAGRTQDTLAWIPTRHANFALRNADGGYTFGPQLFSDAALTIVDPSALRFYIVDRSVTTTPQRASFRVLALGLNRGDTVWDRNYAYTPRRVERARADSLLTVHEQLTSSGHSLRAIRDALFIPDYYTPITSGAAGTDGSLWLRREEGQPAVDYWVISKDGTLVASVTVPANVVLLAATDTQAWGVETDEYDVPTVVRYRIVR
jgi:6-bladed beta-propeller